jgi:hypothetical protein
LRLISFEGEGLRGRYRAKSAGAARSPAIEGRQPWLQHSSVRALRAFANRVQAEIETSALWKRRPDSMAVDLIQSGFFAW